MKRPSKYAGTDPPAAGRAWADVVADFARGASVEAAHDPALGAAPPAAPVAPDVRLRVLDRLRRRRAVVVRAGGAAAGDARGRADGVRRRAGRAGRRAGPRRGGRRPRGPRGRARRVRAVRRRRAGRPGGRRRRRGLCAGRRRRRLPRGAQVQAVLRRPAERGIPRG